MIRNTACSTAMFAMGMACLVLIPARAAAQSREEQALVHYKEGEKLRRDDAFAEALGEFQKALAIRSDDGAVAVATEGTTKAIGRKTVTVPGKIVEHDYYPNRGAGLCHWALGNPAEAARLLQASMDKAWTREAQDALQRVKAGDPPQKRADAPPPEPEKQGATGAEAELENGQSEKEQKSGLIQRIRDAVNPPPPPPSPEPRPMTEIPMKSTPHGQPQKGPAAPAQGRPRAEQTMLPANLKVSIAPGAEIEGGGETEITVTVRNEGMGAAYRLVAKMEVETPKEAPPPSGRSPMDFLVFSPENIIVNKLEPEGVTAVRVRVAATLAAETALVPFLLTVKEANGYDSETYRFEIPIRRVLPPRLAMTDAFAVLDGNGYATIGNKNGSVEPGEFVRLTCEVANAGEGAAKGVAVEVKNTEPPPVSVKAPWLFQIAEKAGEWETNLAFDLGDMAPGERRTFSFFVDVKRAYSGAQGSPLPLAFGVRDARGGDFGAPDARVASLNLGARSVIDLDSPAVAAAGGGAPPAPVPPAPDDAASFGRELEGKVKRVARENPNLYAVIFGVGTYKRLPPVKYAAHDAQRMRIYLRNFVGVPEANIFIHSNDDADLTTFKRVLDRDLPRKVKGAETVYFYYAGHGVPGETGAYLAPHDGEADFPESLYPVSKVGEALQALDAKKVVMLLDSCFSGLGGRSVPLAGRAIVPRPESETLFPRMDAAKLVYMSATTGKVRSFDYEEEKSGLFTFFLTEGMSGKADENRDDVVTAEELHAYVERKVLEEVRRSPEKYGDDQKPTMWPDAPGAEARGTVISAKPR